MSKLLLLFSVGFLILVALTSKKSYGSGFQQPATAYCLQFRDGVSVLVQDGRVINSEVSLENGTKVRPDGTVLRNDGKKLNMKPGECIDQSGIILLSEKYTRDSVRKEK